MKIYKYTFTDGYVCWTCGKMDKLSLSHEVRKHGRLLSMVLDG